MAQNGRNRCETHPVRQRERCRQEERGVFLICLWVDGVLRRQDACHVVRTSRVVCDAVLADGEVVGVPGTGIVNGRRDDPEQSDDADQRVADGVPWRNQRTAVEGVDLRPVEREAGEREGKRDPGGLPKQLVDDDIVWLDPCHPRKVAQGRHDEVGEPLPYEDGRHQVHKPSVSRNDPAKGLFRIARAVVVQSVHERHIDQSRRPDHRGRLNKPSANHTGKAESQTLSGQSKEDVEAPSEALDVVELLHGYHGVDEVSCSATECGVCHGNDDDMLLDVERARVEVRLHAEQGDLLVRHDLGPADADRVRDQLDHVGRDGDDRVSQDEQSVDTRHDRGHDKADGPCADGAGRDVFIVVADDSSHLTCG